MGFLGGVFKSIGNAVKSFATSTLGSTLLKGLSAAFLGPIGPTLVGAATNLLKNGFNAKNLIKTGLNLFGGLATGGFGGGTFAAVKNLASSVLPSTGLGGLAKTVLGGVLNGKGVSGILTDVFQNTDLGKKAAGVLGKVTNALGVAKDFGTKASGFLGQVSGFLGNVGIKPPAFLDQFAGKLQSGLRLLDTISGFADKVNNVLGGGTANMLRA